NSRAAKDDTFYNSRTNLINDRDVYIEDIVEDPESMDTDKGHFQRSKVNHKVQHHRRSDNEAKHADDDSMYRHEMDRGSDIDYHTARSSLRNKREFFIRDGNIEILQLMTRDKTRDAATAVDDDNIYVNLPVKSANHSQPHLLNADNSGKEILMRRFIEEQPDGKQIIREHYQIVPGATYIQSMPNEIQQHTTLKGDSFALGKSGANSIVYSQTEPEVKVIHTQPVHGTMALQTNGLSGQMQPSTSNQSLTHDLENSLKHQNELLRKILLDKDKIKNRYTQQEVVLETQSLPGQYVAISTQTECEVGTQTDANAEFLQTTSVNTQGISVRRKARSENDDSLSENEHEYLRFAPPNSTETIYWLKRKKQKNHSKYRRDKHPHKRVVMLEEVKRKIRTPIKEDDEYKKRTPPKKPLRKHIEKNTSFLRRKKTSKIEHEDGAIWQTQSEADHEVLIEISDSLGEKSGSSDHFGAIRVGEIECYSQNGVGTSYANNVSSDDIDDETNNSNESDADEIIIKRNVFTSNHFMPKNDSTETNPKKSYKICLNKEIDAREKVNANLSRSASDERERILGARLPITINSPSQRLNRCQSSSGPPYSRSDIEKHKSSSLNVISNRHKKIPRPNQSANGRVYQSANDLNYQDNHFHESTEKGVPKYMEWYYSKRKIAGNRGATEPLKAAARKRNNVSEKRVLKTHLRSKAEVSNYEEGKFKPEPAPRKSPSKNTRLLKEDIAMNKQHKPKIETDTSHPLLQHSEHRFERENAPGVPLPPSKLPHYMYPETPPFTAFKETPENNMKTKFKTSPIRENEVKVGLKVRPNVENSSSAHVNTNSQKQLNASTLEDDHDSGIAMNSLLNSMGRRNPIADKKSVFSIAYDDVSRVRKITSGGESPQYS
ncbi:PREDICTED: cadherin-86C-like, partial [Rhagoletis zephyria]|uniref:cadherin-86C-like n=1 Tax=Rhagoletis zephyria TaxID=28612 RepID=UPI000811542A